MTGQRVGYIRVSTVEQNEARQLDGVQLDETFTDKASGRDRNRPGLDAMLKHVRKGDRVLVHSLDRLGRNVDDLRALIEELNGRGVSVEFVTQGLVFDPASKAQADMNKLMLTMLGAFAEFELAMIRERQAEGIAKAKAAGKYRGRKPALTEDQAAQMLERLSAGEPVAALAREYCVSRQTIYATRDRANA